MVAWHTCRDQDFVQVGRKQLPKISPNWKFGFFFKLPNKISRKEILHISAIMSLGLKGCASCATVEHFELHFLHFQVPSPVGRPNWSQLLNILSGLLFQAAGKGVWKSCRLMFILNTRLKRCKMSPRQKSWKANSGSSSVLPPFSGRSFNRA